MALSEQVELSLRDAQENLRNALSFSARSEKPFISKHIADMLAEIENLLHAVEIVEKIENRKEGDNGLFGLYVDDPEKD
tara:strand:+ start:258 stop:494 length:237 start_codon:yes stop_codon:yes gene_type:complete